jgi:hypothetical protein
VSSRPRLPEQCLKTGESSPYGPLAPPRVSGARAPAWSARTGTSVFFARSARTREHPLWTQELRPWLFRHSGGLGSKKSRLSAPQCAFGGGPGLGWSGAYLAECPDGPNRPPWIPPPAGPIPSLGYQHTSMVLGGLSECAACAFGAHSVSFRNDCSEGQERRTGT